MTEVIRQGMYAGIPYQVVKKQGRIYIALQASAAVELTSKGANMKLLDDIGDKDPDEVMKSLLESIKK